MKLKFSKSLLLIFCLAIFSAVKANITVPEIFGSNMVLQQKSEVKIWGWAKPGEPVKLTVDWHENAIETKADNQGTWSLLV